MKPLILSIVFAIGMFPFLVEDFSNPVENTENHLIKDYPAYLLSDNSLDVYSFTLNGADDECCNTGGSGSIECSDEGSIGILYGLINFSYSNSVTCESGQYACCDGDGAHCQEEGEDAWCTEP